MDAYSPALLAAGVKGMVGKGKVRLTSAAGSLAEGVELNRRLALHFLHKD